MTIAGSRAAAACEGPQTIVSSSDTIVNVSFIIASVHTSVQSCPRGSIRTPDAGFHPGSVRTI